MQLSLSLSNSISHASLSCYVRTVSELHVLISAICLPPLHALCSCANLMPAKPDCQAAYQAFCQPGCFWHSVQTSTCSLSTYTSVTPPPPQAGMCCSFSSSHSGSFRPAAWLILCLSIIYSCFCLFVFFPRACGKFYLTFFFCLESIEKIHQHVFLSEPQFFYFSGSLTCGN